jgi:predicted aldo/keto reductase-like oxidoreductase
LKPFPRDSYVLMTKVTTDQGVDPHERFEDMLRTHKAEYFDIMLLHWQHSAGWVEGTKNWQDAIDHLQTKKTILSRGASVHGLPALREMPGNPWLQVAMIRMNHKGTRMDGPSYDDNDNPKNVSEVVQHVQQVKQNGMGVVSMKLVGDGVFTKHEDRVAAMRFAFQKAKIDCATVGFKNTQEIDEAIDNMNLALSLGRYQKGTLPTTTRSPISPALTRRKWGFSFPATSLFSGGEGESVRPATKQHDGGHRMGLRARLVFYADIRFARSDRARPSRTFRHGRTM